MTDIVIVAARRTPQGRLLGSLAMQSAADLGTVAAQAALEPIGADAIDQVIVGNVLSAGLGMNVARQIALRAGIAQAVPAFSVNMMCGSGMQAVVLAAQLIRAGEAQVVLCGGTESMSNAPHLLQRAPESCRVGSDGRIDHMLRDGLTDPLAGEHMGLTAERLAGMYRITREEQDACAEHSHAAYAAAHAAGAFARELVVMLQLARDEHPRPGLTAAKLGTLKPAFSASGTITPGNASGINDGAAMLVITSAANAGKRGWAVLARIRAWSAVGCDPATMGLGPVHAIRRLEERSGLRAADCDTIELNEAFAAQAIACQRELKLPAERVNRDGGAIALGHPIGATGARLVVHLAQRTAAGSSQRSLASLCIGGGMGLAIALDNGVA
ncbi:MAG: acetyl-CoA C-acyltransferase [Planctomycetota bacterium]